MQLLRAIHQKLWLILFVSLVSTSLFGCGGGGGSAPTPTSHTVNISWPANREAAVNKAGGGYKVAISGQPLIDVPYVSGLAAPTTTIATLTAGNYSVTVTAYSALSPTGGATGSTSVPSATFTFSVP
jgi:hypothetical protein